MESIKFNRNVSMIWPVVFSAVFELTSCGNSSGGLAAAPVAPATESKSTEPEASKNYTMVIASDSDLPTCNADNNKQLVYISGSSSFKSCDAGTWTAISINGKDGADGLSISSNQLLNPYTTNICTSFSSIEECYFSGGQLIKFSDGSIMITGMYSYDLYVDSTANGGSADTDRMANSITIIVPPSAPGAFQRLDWSVSRGSTYMKALYMVYDRVSDTVKILFDSNGNNTPGTGDEVVHTVVKASW